MAQYGWTGKILWIDLTAKTGKLGLLEKQR